MSCQTRYRYRPFTRSSLRSPLPRYLFAAVSALLAIALGGCAPPGGGTTASTSHSAAPTLPTIPFTSTTTSTTAAPQPVDYRRLLLSAADLTDAEDTFTEQSSNANPNGSPGASAFFVNAKDSRAIVDTFLVYPDAATAAATLTQAAGTLPTLVKGGTPKPLPVGTDGVIVSGAHPTEDKAVTLIFFAEGKALVRLEFQSATGDPTKEGRATAVAKMQDIALRAGLAGPE